MEKRFLIIFFSLFSFFSLISIQNISALSCTIRSGSCNAGEACLFSMVKLNNSHVGDCNQYNYKVCCDELTSTIRNYACNADEGAVISIYNTINSHAAAASYYSKKVCAKFNNTNYGIECNVRDSCLTNETCVVSLFKQNNAHAATCDYYSKKVCCRALPDLLVDQTSISFNNTSPREGEAVLLNITVWNIGDSAASQVNVSCYVNGNYFDSDVINSIPPDVSQQTPRYATCTWTASCPASNNITVRVDPSNAIKELNESNNEAWRQINLTESLNIAIDNPVNGSSYYRGQTLNLNSTVTVSCGGTPDKAYNVTWYNETTKIAEGEDTTWQIPLGDFILGTKMIKADATSTYYDSGTDNVNITILNNLPQFEGPGFNVTPAEIEAGQSIQISCNVTDVEDDASQLTVNISVKDASGVWSNITASRIGNTFYRDYATTDTSPIGNYTTVCTAVDHNNGYSESTLAYFLVYQNATVTVNLNSTYYWWNDGVRVYGNVKRTDGTAVYTSPDPTSNVTVLVDNQQYCMTDTDSQGDYTCSFTAPGSVGTYTLIVRVPDPLTGKVFRNSTSLVVNPKYGGNETGVKEMSCFALPQIVVNPDGSIKTVMVKVCTWK
jgi:hypothetical protein